ncbi:hypothetical protein BT63DRAFT_463740 [Microthyrium microscopicum]|uniref:Uncharacterized protein n=1 Tax=Microthyrium microscopicum TaxID=703497 RepID=A0A6A6U2K8_9PEZI|nr:hypothetical protein BT63DRAFT_463740 [Microthyrium microscopicum]
MFNNREYIKEHKWNLTYKTKKIEQHPDWWLFVAYVKTHIVSGEFLFEPYQWDKTWFARTIVESAEFPVREEIMDFVPGLRGRFPEQPTPPRDIFKSLRTRPKPVKQVTWPQAEKDIIELAAMEIWVEWRQEAERKLQMQDCSAKVQ